MNIDMNWLHGKKTYLIVAIGVIANGLYVMGYIPPELIPSINILLGFLGLAALRSGMSKI